MGKDDVDFDATPLVPFTRTQVALERIMSRIREACEMIEWGGDIANLEPFVRSLEIGVVSKPVCDMFGEPIEGLSQLDQVLRQMVELNEISRPMRGLATAEKSSVFRFIETKSQLKVVLWCFEDKESLQVAKRNRAVFGIWKLGNAAIREDA